MDLFVDVDAFYWRNFEEYECWGGGYAKCAEAFFGDVDESSAGADVATVFEFP